MQALPKLRQAINKNPSTTQFSLNRNDFEFNEEVFQQIRGCAIGKKFFSFLPKVSNPSEY